MPPQERSEVMSVGTPCTICGRASTRKDLLRVLFSHVLAILPTSPVLHNPNLHAQKACVVSFSIRKGRVSWIEMHWRWGSLSVWGSRNKVILNVHFQASAQTLFISLTRQQGLELLERLQMSFLFSPLRNVKTH